MDFEESFERNSVERYHRETFWKINRVVSKLVHIVSLALFVPRIYVKFDYIILLHKI